MIPIKASRDAEKPSTIPRSALVGRLASQSNAASACNIHRMNSFELRFIFYWQESILIGFWSINMAIGDHALGDNQTGL